MKINSIYAITFLDHAKGDGTLEDAFEFTAYGKLVSITKTSYILEFWTYTDGRDSDNNSERLVILKSTITGKAVLTEAQ